MPRILRPILLSLLIVATSLAALVYSLTWHPSAREELAVACTAQAPELQPGQALKLMTWNVQYLAGKRYLFWHDLPDGSGPDLRPTAADLAYTLDEVARVIRDEAPDLVLLQELHDGARASDYQDQLALLNERISDLYPCSTQAFYWQAAFVPHPKILGSVGMKLATLSRFRIERAERLQLPQLPADPLSRQFGLKRALQLNYLPVRGGGRLAVINTHLDSFVQGDDTLRRQVEMSRDLLDRLEAEKTPWVFGGDLELLPPGQYQRLDLRQRAGYSADGEQALLTERYPVIPSQSESGGSGQAAWYTHFPNDPRVQAPDRTLDYLFHSSQLIRLDANVRQRDTLQISDHLPLIGRFLLPAPN
ncbi:endonuclease/exonuclease/phosphatase family protein [Zestomonas carbonaria]|uniref:Endonuclease/exonuclease/phosphatase domain-containing protein n=1 Tax=Zestomonas carbonaria TaxID=2762745 RepID=A0A7U7I8R1_9GAMM|nr:endonuclease/exonuclease/phosphatase family protein [Pseudomonas carbonaria]CAD5107589.1 hypothetical protein PSEWESI4_01862 [Pseudomonas carbonaria]